MSSEVPADGAVGDLGAADGTVPRRPAAPPTALRRSLALLGMTVLAPGSAQIVAGNRRVGRLVLRGCGVLLGLVALAGLTLWLHRPWFLSLATDPGALWVLRVALVVLALGWILLLTDAWRLGDPLRLTRRHRAVTTAFNATLCFVAGGALLFGSHLVAVQRDFIGTVFAGTVVQDPYEGRYNVLLLGGDAGEDRWGLRPDSINVASIDEETGRTVLFSLPRNLENVPFPEGSVMHEQFPDGFTCDECYLNGVYTWALDNAELFDLNPQRAGIEATRQAVEGATGLEVGYYAMVNLKGFTTLVDAVGGVEIDVPTRIPIGGGGGPITGWIEPGVQRLDGYQTQWFARSRAADNDYARMGRQKCVLNAMLQQLSPQQVVLQVRDIAEAGKELLRTDIPASELDTFIDLALKARHQPIASVSFVPPRIQTYDPDYALIHQMVEDALTRAQGEQVTREPGSRADAARGDRPRRPRGGDAPRGNEAANTTADLSTSC